VSSQKAPGRSGVLIGASGLFLALCCVALPVVFGIAIGAAVGGVLDATAAVLVAVGIVLVLRRRRAGKCQRC